MVYVTIAELVWWCLVFSRFLLLANGLSICLVLPAGIGVLIHLLSTISTLSSG